MILFPTRHFLMSGENFGYCKGEGGELLLAFSGWKPSFKIFIIIHDEKCDFSPLEFKWASK